MQIHASILAPVGKNANSMPIGSATDRD